MCNVGPLRFEVAGRDAACERGNGNRPSAPGHLRAAEGVEVVAQEFGIQSAERRESCTIWGSS